VRGKAIKSLQQRPRLGALVDSSDWFVRRSSVAEARGCGSPLVPLPLSRRSRARTPQLSLPGVDTVVDWVFTIRVIATTRMSAAVPAAASQNAGVAARSRIITSQAALATTAARMGTGEEPHCPVYIDGQHFTTLKGTYEELATAFRALVDDYVATKYPRKEAARPVTA
jgi:hypothetical protein